MLWIDLGRGRRSVNKDDLNEDAKLQQTPNLEDWQMMDVLYKRPTVVVKIGFGLRKKSGRFVLYYDSYLVPYRADDPC